MFVFAQTTLSSRATLRLLASQHRALIRAFTATSINSSKPLPPRPKIKEDEIEEAFVKGSGPGGQVINKTSSAVQLKHLPTGIVVKSQATRSRMQNRKIARRILAERLDELEKGDASRTTIKAERARKKKSSASKKSQRKYRKLEEEKEKDVAAVDVGNDVDRAAALTGRIENPNLKGT